MDKTCDTCQQFHDHKKLFLSDGLCFLIAKKPTPVRRSNTCKHWKQKQRKEDENDTV